MSNFWARKVAESAPKPVQRPAQAPLSGPWWATPHPQPAAPQQEAQPPQQPGPDDHRVIGLESIRANRYAAATQEGLCPGCGGTDYFAPTGTQRKRCFACGYPVVQSTSGMSSTSAAGGAPGKPARQVSSMTVTDGSGRILGSVAASAGAGGRANYNPTDTQAGRIS
jgi:hypothetical protein